MPSNCKIKKTIAMTASAIREMTVHFFILLSKDLDLFLPKNVSLEPPNASIPVELPGWNKITTTANTAADEH